MELGNFTELKRNILAAHNALKSLPPMGEIDMGRMEILPIEEIECDYSLRMREEYGNHKDLIEFAQNIARFGLIHPIVVYSPSGNPPFQLLAGGRRMIACKEVLGVNEISCRIFCTPKTQEELRAIEYYENMFRKDFTWQEQDRMRRLLHLTLVEMQNEKVGHSQADTARILNVSKATVNNSIRRAEIMEAAPQLGIQNAKNAFEADKKLKVAAASLRAQINAEPMPKNITEKQKLILDSYIRGNFFDNKLPDATFNFLEVDPPYGINLAKTRFYEPEEIMDIKNYIEPLKEDYPEFLEKLIKECWRLGAKDSWLIMWHAVSWGDTIRELLVNQGYHVAHADAIWVKGANPGYTNQVDTILGHAHELFIYARKGIPMLHNKGRSDVFNHPVVPINQRIHPTEKPISLYKDILQTFCFGGHKILSPFAGSGSCLLAAYDYGMSAKGFDLSPTFFASYFKRVMEAYRSE